METIQSAAETLRDVTILESTREVAPDLVRLPLSIVNVYLYGKRQAGDRGWVLIDAGLPTSRSAIEKAATERFGPMARPAAIILTHGHFDHVGALPAFADQMGLLTTLADKWDVPVFAHELELPYLSGRASYPPPDPMVGGGAMSWLSALYPRGPIDLGKRLQTLPADGTVPSMPGWRWIHTPGHSPGHVALFRDNDRTLIAGDAFVTQPQESILGVLTRKQHVHRPPAYFTLDWQAARDSVAKLAELLPEIAATGHGIPMRGETMRRQLSELLENWDRDALPARGRYVRQPAVADKDGIVSYPAPWVDPRWPTLAALGAAAIGAALLARGKSGPQVATRPQQPR